MTLPVKKIYVDSRYMTSDSTSTSNFKFQTGTQCLHAPEHGVLPRRRLYPPRVANRRSGLQRHSVRLRSKHHHQLPLPLHPDHSTKQLRRRHVSNSDTNPTENDRPNLHSNLQRNQSLYQHQPHQSKHHLHHTFGRGTCNSAIRNLHHLSHRLNLLESIRPQQLERPDRQHNHPYISLHINSPLCIRYVGLTGHQKHLHLLA